LVGGKTNYYLCSQQLFSQITKRENKLIEEAEAEASKNDRTQIIEMKQFVDIVQHHRADQIKSIEDVESQTKKARVKFFDGMLETIDKWFNEEVEKLKVHRAKELIERLRYYLGNRKNSHLILERFAPKLKDMVGENFDTDSILSELSDIGFGRLIEYFFLQININFQIEFPNSRYCGQREEQ